MPGEFAAACRLLASHLPPDVAAARADHYLQLLLDGDIDPAGLLVARGGAGRVTGAVLTQVTPGHAGSLTPPAGAGALGLIAAALDRFRRAGVTHAQCLIDASDPADPRPLLDGGFTRNPDLVTVRRSGLLGPLPDGGRVELVPFARVRRDVIAATLLGTYAGSLDCPELDRVRPAADVLDGFDAAFTAGGYVAHADGSPVGVGVLAPAGRGAELAYLGLVPTARGRGLGRDLLARLVADAGPADVSASVDARNTPARRLYDRAGFTPAGSRAVYLWFPDG